jgi:hypothetical protein
MYYLFLKPEFTSQYPVPGARKGAAKDDAKPAKSTGLKPAGGDANK